jgi:hypothetical protein
VLQASEVLFGDAWLFRAPGRAEPLELLAMLGQPEGRGFELKVANWDCAEACARELAKPLNVSPEALLLAADDDEGSGEESGEESSAEEGIAWSAATAAMQGLAEQAVLMIRCESEGAGAHAHGLGLAFLGRIVGCVANAHIASQARARCMHAPRRPCARAAHARAVALRFVALAACCLLVVTARASCALLIADCLMLDCWLLIAGC